MWHIWLLTPYHALYTVSILFCYRKYLSYDVYGECSFSSMFTHRIQPNFQRNLKPKKNKCGSYADCVRWRNSQKTCISSQVRPRHRSQLRCVYLSIALFFAVLEVNLIKPTTSVLGAGCAQKTHQIAFNQ